MKKFLHMDAASNNESRCCCTWDAVQCCFLVHCSRRSAHPMFVLVTQVLGHDNTLTYEPWPEHDEALLVENSMKLPVQVRHLHSLTNVQYL